MFRLGKAAVITFCVSENVKRKLHSCSHLWLHLYNMFSIFSDTYGIMTASLRSRNM